MLFSKLRKARLIFSLNDPGWGRGSQNNEPPKNPDNNRKPPEGPPDLDQLWRDFNQRLNRMFGNRKGGGGGTGGDSPSDMKGAGIGIGAILAVALFLWAISGFFIVQEGQTAVVKTFGKYSHSTPAGFNWRWPYPIQSHETVNVSEVRIIEVGYRGNVRNKQVREALMLTEDENIIDIQFAVQYRLKSAADWIFNNRDKDEMVKQVAETAIREVVGKNKMDFVLYEGREQVALDTSELMQQILDRYGSGVQVAAVTMQNVQPPEQVQAAFDDAVKAGQDRERLKNEGQAYANNVIPRARGSAARLMEEAEAYRAQSVATAQGDAERFRQVVAEYQKAPAVTRERMYLETMQQIFTNTSKIMVDARTGNNLLYLPLDKLIAQTATGDANAAARPPAPTLDGQQSAAPVTSDDGRNRDARTNRDREGR
ncbi:MAG TPA: FtsH protease activity modulator HflK [Advenella sp.]|nr:FtsH protease activity modulator HflK [Advenella sp.]